MGEEALSDSPFHPLLAQGLWGLQLKGQTEDMIYNGNDNKVIEYNHFLIYINGCNQYETHVFPKKP